jgi:hypothetical protein
MESQRKPSPGQWAPWIEDPDPPMSDDPQKRSPEGLRALLERMRQERSNKPDAEK